MEIQYLDAFHLINKAILDGAPCLVKVGVFETVDLVKFRELYPEGKIIAYEADEKNFIQVRDNVKGVIDKFYNRAVGIHGDMEFYRYTNPVSNSIYPRHQKDANCVLAKKTTVKSVDLKTVFEHNELDYIDVLILNCEGGELPIMEDLLIKSIRDKIGQICVSFHDPRIYPSDHKNTLLDELKDYYHIIIGESTYISDYLLVRKVGENE